MTGEESKVYEDQVDTDTQGEYEAEKNLIFYQSDYIRVYVESKGQKDEFTKLELITEFNVNDKIVNVIKVPTN